MPRFSVGGDDDREPDHHVPKTFDCSRPSSTHLQSADFCVTEPAPGYGQPSRPAAEDRKPASGFPRRFLGNSAG